jgi:hypothetical protein
LFYFLERGERERERDCKSDEISRDLSEVFLKNK